MADKNTTADKSNAQAEQNQPHVQHAENAAAQPTATSEAPHAATPADFFGKAAFFNADGVAAAQKFFDVQALTAAAKTWVPDAVVAATQKIMDDQRKSVEQFAAAQRQLAEQFAAEQGKMLEQWWALPKRLWRAWPICRAWRARRRSASSRKITQREPKLRMANGSACKAKCCSKSSMALTKWPNCPKQASLTTPT